VIVAGEDDGDGIVVSANGLFLAVVGWLMVVVLFFWVLLCVIAAVPVISGGFALYVGPRTTRLSNIIFAPTLFKQQHNRHKK
jgi:hypothetical protein